MAKRNASGARSTSVAPLTAKQPKPYSSGVKENEQDPNAAQHPVRIDLPNATLPQIDEDLERQKARGQTESQKQMRAYHEGRFQSHDPATHKPRDKFDAVKEAAK